MDRITRLHILNVRAFERLDLDLVDPATVLIGENGSGKSTVLECLELLRKSADPQFLSLFYAHHRGMPGLLRKGASYLGLGVRVEREGGGGALDYGFTLGASGNGVVVTGELLDDVDQGHRVLAVAPGEVVFHPLGGAARDLTARSLGGRAGHWLPALGDADDPTAQRVLAALRGIEVHLGFDSRASWAARTYQRPESLRVASTLFPAERLGLLGFNLANAWSELLARPSARREEATELVRLGLGERVDSVVVRPDPGGGNVYLGLRFKDLAEPVLAAELSDGQLAWLAWVAMALLGAGRSLLAVDEPELHLHPALLGRVVSLLCNLPDGAPVLLSTHSDRVLELLDDPAEALRVCTLEGSRAVVSYLDREQLPRWLAEFGDLGQLRAAGYLHRVLVPGSAQGADDGAA